MSQQGLFSDENVCVAGHSSLRCASKKRSTVCTRCVYIHEDKHTKSLEGEKRSREAIAREMEETGLLLVDQGQVTEITGTVGVQSCAGLGRPGEMSAWNG